MSRDGHNVDFLRFKRKRWSVVHPQGTSYRHGMRKSIKRRKETQSPSWACLRLAFLIIIPLIVVTAMFTLWGGFGRTARGDRKGNIDNVERILFHRFPNENTNNGNNLFGWASTLGLAELHGMKPCFSMMGVGENLHNSFELDGGECQEMEGLFERLQNRWFPRADRSQAEAGYATHQQFYIPSSANRFTVTGYLQSFKYFPKDMAERIRFKGEIETRNSALVQSIAKGRVTVGVHIRHSFEGDGQTVYLRFPPNEYFEGVLDYFREKHGQGNVVFIVAGDDSEYLRNAPWINGQEDVLAIPHEPSRTPIDDLASLAACDNMVITVGTFGWWAAFLGDLRNKFQGDIIYYSDMFNMEIPPNRGNVIGADHFPPHWISIDGRGLIF